MEANVPRRKPKRWQGTWEGDLFGEEGYKRLPDEIYRRYGFTPAKVEVEEHHVKVYAGKKTEDIVRAPHPETLSKGSLVSLRWKLS